jgi:hypothetical protein
MDKIIGVCGLTCTDCPAYQATQKDDDEERKKVAEMWSKEYGAEIKPADINCDGCTVLDGRHFDYCGKCEIRKCGVGREVSNCGHCEDYACEKLTKFFEMVPPAKATLDEIKGGLQE